jgi:mannosyl-3-phosphoglycerate phosphatase
VAVATDLDACLLDEWTYSWEPARPALTALRERGVPLVLASSKTRAEMEALAEALGEVAALIVENGGAIVPRTPLPGLGMEVVVLGAPRERLVAALAEMARETAAHVRGFSRLGVDELAALTGLDREGAARALAREYDEPFLLDDGDPGRLGAAAEARGLALTRGGRFLHLTGRTDKGRALRRLREAGRAAGWDASWVALGDSPNDVEMLAAADRAVIVPRPDGRPDAVLAATLPRAMLAPAPGPAGWSAAVLSLLGEAPAGR